MKSAVAEALSAWKVEDFLNATDYSDNPDYVPSDFALEFVVFIKLINGEEGEEHETPVVHYRMLDTITAGGTHIINLCHRGIAKTAVMGEYLFLYLGVYGYLPGFGKVDLALYVSDSIENGVKNMRKNLEFRWENSDFLKMQIPFTRFTDIRWEFKNADGNVFLVKGYGAKALSLDTEVVMLNGSTKTIKDIQVDDYVMSPLGYQARVIAKSEVFNHPMYRILLEDGRSIKVSNEHLNAITIKINPNNTAVYKDIVRTTDELLNMDLQHVRVRNRKGKIPYVSRENLLFIKNTLPVGYFTQKYTLDPYVLGLLLGDGSLKKDGSNVLHAHIDDMNEYYLALPDTLGNPYLDKRNNTVVSVALKGISAQIKELGLRGIHGDFKFIPKNYLIGDISQRIAILQGLMDTDGSIQKNGRMDFCSNSEQLVDDVSTLVRNLGGTAKKRKVKKAFRVEIWLGSCPFRLNRKVNRFIKNKIKPLVAISSIEPIPNEPSQCIKVQPVVLTNTDEDCHFLVNDYFRTHNTGVRGAKEMAKRPQLAVLDDLISDEDARSATVIASVEATVYKAVTYALHPDRRMIIWSGTPFNAKDPLYKAVESGAWAVNVFPVCEQFPCTKEEFRGSWPDRFTYKYVKENYDIAIKNGMVDTFNQELMLRIMSEEDRVIQDSDIGWYKIDAVLRNKGMFNFYITTDFATSEKQKADFSVVSVWAYNNVGDYLWVDGICKRQLMDATIDDVFRLSQLYKPQAVGIEVNGQQGGFIPWIQAQMMERNIYFTLATSHNENKPGIRNFTNKLVHFNTMVPLFKARKMFFPIEKKAEPPMVECINELSLIAAGGIRSKHDDFIDTISMLSSIVVWKPSEEAPMVSSGKGDGMWDLGVEEVDRNRMDSYIV